jgi:Xaa-Pro aminopeptidase
LNNQNLEVIFVNITSIIEDLITQLTEQDGITLEGNIAVKYYNAIQKAFPENNISFSEGYLIDIKILKNKQEKDAIKQAITIIDHVFLFIESLALNDDIL